MWPDIITDCNYRRRYQDTELITPFTFSLSPCTTTKPPKRQQTLFLSPLLLTHSQKFHFRFPGFLKINQSHYTITFTLPLRRLQTLNSPPIREQHSSTVTNGRYCPPASLQRALVPLPVAITTARPLPPPFFCS